MAKKSRWSRYRPPAEPRTEAGIPIDPPARTPEPKPARRPERKPTRKPTAPHRPPSWVKPLVVLAVVVAVVVGIALAVASGGDDDAFDNADVETETLQKAFIERGLAAAAAEEPDRGAVAVHLDEYGMTVEYFDPAKDESRYVETRTYTEDRTIRVEKNFYSDFKPQPFDLAVVDPDAMIRSVEAALGEADDPYSWEVRIRVEDGDTTPTMVTRVSAKESVERTAAP